MSRMIDKKWLYEYYNSQEDDTHRMYEGGGFREYKQIRRLSIIRDYIAQWNLSGSYILDIGCGDGHAASLLLKGGDFAYIGFDYSQQKLKSINMKQQSSAVMVGDAENIPVTDKSIDYILCLETLEHLVQPDVSVKEISRVLREKGICIISIPINSSLQPFIRRIIRFMKGNAVFDEHIQTVTVERMRDMLRKSGLDVFAMTCCGFNLPFLNIVLDRMPYHIFEKIDRMLSHVPLCYTGAGIHAGISLGIGNEYLIIAAQKT